MKTTIGSFAELVERDYGADVAGEFVRSWSGSSGEIDFQQAMDVLDQVLAPSSGPLFPSSGATNSIRQRGSLRYAD